MDGEVVEIARRDRRVVAPGDRREGAPDRVRKRRIDVDVKVGEQQQRESVQLGRQAGQGERFFPDAHVEAFAVRAPVEAEAAEGQADRRPDPLHRAPAQAPAQMQLAFVFQRDAPREGRGSGAARERGGFGGRDRRIPVGGHGAAAFQTRGARARSSNSGLDLATP